MSKIIHKIGPQKVTKYVGFGRYEEIPAPLCVGAKEVYAGRSFFVHRLRKYVTCKHCLRMLNTQQRLQ